jgi:hypothetical protein
MLVKVNSKDIPEISDERIAEILAFEDKDISDCPELTPEQLAQLRPGRFRPNAEARKRLEEREQKAKAAN